MQNSLAFALLFTATSLLAGCDKGANVPAPKASEEPSTATPAEPSKAKPASAPELAATTYEALLGLDEAVVPFKPQPVIGKTKDELVAAFPQFVKFKAANPNTDKVAAELMKEFDNEIGKQGFKVPKSVDPRKLDVDLPPGPDAARAATTVVPYDDTQSGKIRGYSLWLDYKSPATADALMKIMETSWGAPKQMKKLGETIFWFDAARGIRASAKPASPKRFELSYVRYLPLKQLFGEAGPIWGFESAQPLIGATLEQLKAAYGDTVEANKEGTAYTMQLPITDYADNSSRTSILMFVKKGKVTQWNVSLPYEDYEGAKAEITAMLEAKLGKGKPAKLNRTAYGKLVNVRDSVGQLRIEVGKL